MIECIADETHFKEMIERVPKVKKSLWIGTADIKDLYGRVSNAKTVAAGSTAEILS